MSIIDKFGEMFGQHKKPPSKPKEIRPPATTPSRNSLQKPQAPVGGRITSWSALLSVIKATKDPMSATNIFSRFGHQVTFALLTEKIDEPSYFKGIPFVSITKDIVEKARQYVDHPPVPGLLAMFDMGLTSDRYVPMSGGKTGRISNPQIDALIVQVAGCLRGRGTFNMNDSVRVANLAYDAIMHYKNIPVVYFFFALPYLDTVIHTKKLSTNDALITVYKGVEGLLLKIYDELGEGKFITDDRVKNKVHQMLKSGSQGFILCPYCQKRLLMQAEHAGQRGGCPYCKQVFMYPPSLPKSE